MPKSVPALLWPIAVGSMACAVIVLAVGAVATVPSGFQPFQPGAYVTFTALGVIAGMVGWLAVRRFAGAPARVLRVLVPSVVLVSLVPDILVGVNQTWPGAIGLMVMHLAVAAAAVASFARFLPLPEEASR